VCYGTTTSDSNERAHFWLPSGEETETATSQQLLDSPVADRMYIDQGEVLRVRVEAEDFYDDEPGPPKMAEGVQVVRDPKRAPYNIIVSHSTDLFYRPLSHILIRPSVFYSGARAGPGRLVARSPANRGGR
jgi:hypothetical protein